MKTFSFLTGHWVWSALVSIWTLSLDSITIRMLKVSFIHVYRIFISPRITWPCCLRLNVNRLAYIDFVEHRNGCISGQNKRIWTNLWFYAFRSVLAGVGPIGTCFCVFSSHLCALSFDWVSILIIFLANNDRIGWKATALNGFFRDEMFGMVDLRCRLFLVGVLFFFLFEITFATQIRNGRAVFKQELFLIVSTRVAIDTLDERNFMCGNGFELWGSDLLECLKDVRKSLDFLLRR